METEVFQAEREIQRQVINIKITPWLIWNCLCELGYQEGIKGNAKAGALAKEKAFNPFIRPISSCATKNGKVAEIIAKYSVDKALE